LTSPFPLELFDPRSRRSEEISRDILFIPYGEIGVLRSSGLLEDKCSVKHIVDAVDSKRAAT
jgi:hypothetical protein